MVAVCRPVFKYRSEPVTLDMAVWLPNLLSGARPAALCFRMLTSGTACNRFGSIVSNGLPRPTGGT